jgi:preprotein translocase subunit SecG
MNFLSIIVYFVHVLVSIFLIGVVLLQQGKGADLAVFGGGASQAAFGARGAANILHRLTVICFVIFIVTTLTIGIVQGRNSTASVISGVDVESSAADSSSEAATDEGTGEADDALPAATDDGATPESGDEGVSAEDTTDSDAPATEAAVDPPSAGDGSEPRGNN